MPLDIDNGWNEYRDWAQRARCAQEGARVWTRWLTWAAVAAALFGAGGSIVAQFPPYEWLSKPFSVLALLATGLVATFGHFLMQTGDEKTWVSARATAEAIKSECFRFAAGVGDYAGGDAQDKFIARRQTLCRATRAANLAPKPNEMPPDGDQRRPPLDMTVEWYVERRLEEQRKDYYLKGQVKHEKALRRVRLQALACAICGCVASGLAIYYPKSFGPVVGVATTIAALVLAHGAIDRHQSLAVSYGTMAEALGRLKESHAAKPQPLAHLVDITERLLVSEHQAWVEEIQKTTPKAGPMKDPR